MGEKRRAIGKGGGCILHRRRNPIRLDLSPEPPPRPPPVSIRFQTYLHPTKPNRGENEGFSHNPISSVHRRYPQGPDPDRVGIITD